MTISRIETLEQLRAVYRPPSERAQRKQLSTLDAHCQRFVALSPFLTTDKSVTDICFDVGFESLGSFSTLFKARLGVSPALYRAAPLKAA